MMHNENHENVILKKEEYNTLIDCINTVNIKMNELIEIVSSNKDINANLDNKNSDNTEIDMKTTIQKMYESKNLSYKQYKVLRYVLENKYNSDMDVSKSTGVSYSSLSQWKRKDSSFKEMYRKILLLKSI